MTRSDPFLAHCVCGRAHRSATQGGADRWADWHQREGCEGCDHVVMVTYEPGRPGHPGQSAAPGRSTRRPFTDGLA